MTSVDVEHDGQAPGSDNQLVIDLLCNQWASRPATVCGINRLARSPESVNRLSFINTIGVINLLGFVDRLGIIGAVGIIVRFGLTRDLRIG